LCAWNKASLDEYFSTDYIYFSSQYQGVLIYAHFEIFTHFDQTALTICKSCLYGTSFMDTVFILCYHVSYLPYEMVTAQQLSIAFAS